MHILHIVPEINEANGVYQVARDLARETGGEVVAACDFLQSNNRTIEQFSEVWVHGMWLPRIWSACWKVLRVQKKLERRVGVGERSDQFRSPTPTFHSNSHPRLIRMTHGSLSPIYLERQGKWKKRLVGPIERWLLRRADRVVVTCEAEKRWVETYEPRVKRVEVTDLKRFFRMSGSEKLELEKGRALHVLYLGRRHPLKGVEFLERAVVEVNGEVGVKSWSWRKEGQIPLSNSSLQLIELRIVSDHFGEELEKDWAWCDVLCLPTLSENFGRVVSEALERGKRVITTDGAPAWEPEGARDKVGETSWSWRKDGSIPLSNSSLQLLYLRGYRDGTDEERVGLLKEALVSVLT